MLKKQKAAKSKETLKTGKILTIILLLLLVGSGIFINLNCLLFFLTFDLKIFKQNV